jgi:hypothetical protein
MPMEIEGDLSKNSADGKAKIKKKWCKIEKKVWTLMLIDY